MPRVSNAHYLRLCHVLRRIWLEEPRWFTYLSLSEQWAIHAYYRPDEDLSDEKLLAHRAAISKEHPSQPQRAGRAVQHMANPKPRTSHAPVGAKHRIVIYPLARPKPDLERMSRALIELARADLEAKREAERAAAAKKKQPPNAA